MNVDEIKNGDIIAYETDELLWLIIFHSPYEPYEDCLHYHALLTQDNELFICGTCFVLDYDQIRCATDEEKQDIFNAIEKDGYEWDSENKKIVKKV